MPRLQTPRSAPVAVVLGLAVLAGCAAPEPIRIDPAIRGGLKDQPEILVVGVGYAPASLLLQTRAQAASQGTGGPGLIGAVVGLAALAVDERQRVEIERLALADPAVRVREQFVTGETGDLGLTNLRAAPEVASSDDVEELRRKLGRGFVFDVRTFSWTLNFDPNKLSGYILNYTGRGRLSFGWTM